jgi:hypothetical protein
MTDIGIVSNGQISGVGSSNRNKAEPIQSQQLVDLTDDIKQSFIRDYKTRYSE